jgi:hypothetical protein
MTAIVTEERPECLGHREDKSTVRQLEKDLVCQMLGKKDGSFSTTGWTQIETIAGEGPECSLQKARGVL